MPKVFRPKINHSTANSPAVKQKETTTSVATHNITSPPITVFSQPEVVVSCENSVAIAKLKEPVEENSSSAHVDIDQSAPSKSKAVSTPVNLFHTKSRRLPQKLNVEPAPALDQPLDRSKVSLRSLLNWVPSNKPPPKYRQDRISKTEQAPTASNSESPLAKELKISSPCSPYEQPSTLPPRDNSSELDMLAPQLRLDNDGNIVLDEASLFIKMPETSLTSGEVRHVTEESGILGVNYSSFRQPKPRSRGPWSCQETVRFYRALSTVGTDFYLMLKLFPNRCRADLLRKFKNENRRHSYLVDQALRDRRNFDLSALVPLSDEEEDHKPSNKRESIKDSPRLTKGRRTDGTQSKRCKSVKGVRNKSNAAVPCDSPNTGSYGSEVMSDRSPQDHVIDTIDAVLSECKPLPSPSGAEHRNPLKSMIDRKRDQLASSTNDCHSEQTDGCLCLPDYPESPIDELDDPECLDLLDDADQLSTFSD